MHSQLLLIMLPALSLTMFMFFFTADEVARVRNSRIMEVWLLAVFSRVPAFSFQYFYAGETGLYMYSGIFPASLAFFNHDEGFLQHPGFPWKQNAGGGGDFFPP